MFYGFIRPVTFTCLLALLAAPASGDDDSSVVLKMVQHGEGYRQPYEKTLAKQEFQWEPGTTLQARSRLEGLRISAAIAPGVELEAEDDTYGRGGIGFTSDFPTVLRRVQVTSSRQARDKMLADLAQREQEARKLQSQHRQPVL